MAVINNSVLSDRYPRALAAMLAHGGNEGEAADVDGWEGLAAYAADDVHARNKRSVQNLPDTKSGVGSAALRERAMNIASDVLGIAGRQDAGGAERLASLKGAADNLYGVMLEGVEEDPKLEPLLKDLAALRNDLDNRSKSGLQPMVAVGTEADGGAGSRVSSAELAAALATGDFFEIVYAVMKMMVGIASSNVRTIGAEVTRKNQEQEQVRSAQQRVRELLSGFKPGAKAEDTLKGTAGYTAEKARAATQAFQDLGWDLSSYGGAITEKTQKQQLDNLIAGMDSKLTSYNNLNSVDTNNLTREAQAAQAYLTGMSNTTTKENNLLTGIASNMGR